MIDYLIKSVGLIILGLIVFFILKYFFIFMTGLEFSKQEEFLLIAISSFVVQIYTKD